ncbi:MAG: WbqC family protein [Elusimicrobia bacterium]|nr:WbqC family protein [Elusimicrobiota bacterium]
MLIAAHQPHFLPWLGYFDRVQKADRFVLLDHVQFERQNYQNRARILMGGRVEWLTVPVVQKSRDERIIDKEVHNGVDGRMAWGRRAVMTLEHAYGRAPFFRRYFPELRELLERRWGRLVDLDLALTGWCLRQLDIRTPLVRSSELGVQGRKSEMVLDLCKRTGASAYMAGMGGSRTYLDVTAFEGHGVRVVWQEYRQPDYRQPGGGTAAVRGLSVVDALFNCGPDTARFVGREVHADGVWTR